MEKGCPWSEPEPGWHWPPEEVQDGRRWLQGKSRAAACEPGEDRTKDQKASGEALCLRLLFHKTFSLRGL